MRHAVDLAERSAKMQLESVVVSVSAGKPGSELISASVDVAGAAVTDGDIARVLAAGSRHSVRPGRAVLHSLPIGYSLDEPPAFATRAACSGIASASTCTS